MIIFSRGKPGRQLAMLTMIASSALARHSARADGLTVIDEAVKHMASFNASDLVPEDQKLVPEAKKELSKVQEEIQGRKRRFLGEGYGDSRRATYNGIMKCHQAGCDVCDEQLRRLISPDYQYEAVVVCNDEHWL